MPSNNKRVRTTYVRCNILKTFAQNDDIFILLMLFFGKFLMGKGKGGKMITSHIQRHIV